MNQRYARRPDCDEFEVKQFPHDCGDCQTDGHYLCSGCKHIAPFEDMELSDNRMRYYPKEYAAQRADEAALDEANEVDLAIEKPAP